MTHNARRCSFCSAEMTVSIVRVGPRFREGGGEHCCFASSVMASIGTAVQSGIPSILINRQGEYESPFADEDSFTEGMESRINSPRVDAPDGKADESIRDVLSYQSVAYREEENMSASLPCRTR